MKASVCLLALLALLACAHAHTPAQSALLQRADCAALLRAADEARAASDPSLARDFALGCSQEKLGALVAASPSPAEALLWCGRARAALGNQDKPRCEPKQVGELYLALRTPITLGPSDPDSEPDPLLLAALAAVSLETGLSFDKDDPQVYVGVLEVSLDHTTSSTVATVPDDKGKKLRVPATAHRFVARAAAQVELSGKTRTLRASEEARDTTWDALPQLAVAARPVPAVPSEQELKRKSALTLLRLIAGALAATPPESVDATDPRGCVSYGRAVNLSSGDASAASRSLGDPDKIAACERLLGEPAGAGIPSP